MGAHGWDKFEDFNPFKGIRFNVAPTQDVAIFTELSGAGLLARRARWGLIPEWWKKDVLPPMTFNARSEEAAEKPTWRGSLQSRRCLMPALGWYEWNENEPVNAKSNQPYYLYCPNAEVVAFAGLWSLWEPPGRNPIVSCALTTREAAPSIAHIHHRMPVVLTPDLFEAWLDPATDTKGALELIKAARSDLKGHRVSSRVNSVKNDAPDLIEEIEAPEQRALF